MGLKCSLLGHSFDEPTVEREREERGSEVVTVVREVQRCARCGEERVVSENKEVTSVVDPEEVGLDEEAGAGSFNDDEFTPPDSPEEDDAEILDETTEREPGEWPEEPGDDDPVPDAGGDPTTDDDPESASDPGPADDATVLGSGDDAPDDVGGVDATPPGLDDDPEVGADPTATDPDPDPGADLETGESLTVPEGSFRCPECGHEVDADSSFRAGDACPECQRGYLEEGD
jgi:DNA-directed RNA polymerase subunit RPC12/RpoP